MAEARKVQLRREPLDLIALWLAIHGGDPVPFDQRVPSSEILWATAIHELAAGLSDAGASKIIRQGALQALDGAVKRLHSDPMPGRG